MSAKSRFTRLGTEIVSVIPFTIFARMSSAQRKARSMGRSEARLRSYVLRLLKTKIEPLDRRGAPLRIYSPLTLYSREAFKVGKAGSFLLRTGGEGNRLAMLTAKALVDSLVKSGLSEWKARFYYRRYTREYRNEVSTSRFLLSIVARAPPELGRRILEGLPRFFWRRFVEARVYSGTAALVLASRPSLAFKAARALLSSPA
jgi:flavin-dependent dehydrogenase